MASTSTPSSNYLQRNLHPYNSSQKFKPFFHDKTPVNLSFLLPASNRSLVFQRTNSSNATKYNEVVVDDEMDRVRRLQNGSDVRGVAVEGEKGRTVDLTTPVAEAIAESFGEWVIKKLEEEKGRPVEDVKISLGRDPRISGASLSVGIFAGLARAGCMVFDMGLATTPACFMSTLLPPFYYDASIMVYIRNSCIQSVQQRPNHNFIHVSIRLYTMVESKNHLLQVI